MIPHKQLSLAEIFDICQEDFKNDKFTFLWALIFNASFIFSIPTASLLLVFLHHTKPLRNFCGFTKVPDVSKITRFKQNFLLNLHLVFDNLFSLLSQFVRLLIFQSGYNHL